MTRRFRCPAVRLKPCKHAPCCRLPPTVDARICILSSGGGGRVVGARPLPPVTRFVTVSYPTVSYRFVPDSYRFVPYMYRAHVDRNRAPYRAPTERRHERQRAATSAAPSVCPVLQCGARGGASHDRAFAARLLLLVAVRAVGVRRDARARRAGLRTRRRTPPAAHVGGRYAHVDSRYAYR